MSNFVIECPDCGTMHRASNFLFAKKTIKCPCGRVIDIRKDSLLSEDCPHCGNRIMVDARKGDKAICPVCKKPVHTESDINNFVRIRCPQCACELNVKKPHGDHAETTCPLCDTKIDIVQAIYKLKATESNLISVIKYEGDNDTFVWKHPIEDFNAGTQLIVHESQVAVFFRDGIALDTFPSGEYTLDTKTLPLLGGTVKLPSDAGTDAVFHCEVYFINMVTHLGYKWGTPERIRLIDPITSMYIDIGARGSMNIRVSDPRKLLIKLVGSTSTLKRNDIQGGPDQKPALASFFKDIIVARVRTHLSKSIKNEKIDLMEIDERLDELSASLQQIINEDIGEYGFALENFLILSVDLPTDNENYVKLKKLHDERILTLSQKSAERDYADADSQIEYAKKTREQTLNVMDATNEAQIARINIEKARAEAEAIVAKAQADAEAMRARGGAGIDLYAARERVKAESTRLSGIASADAYAAQSKAEAEEMRAKGYTYQQETSRQIGLEAMQNGLPGTGVNGSGGGVGSVVGDMVGLGVTLGAVGSVVEMAKNTVTPVMSEMANTTQQSINGNTGWNCACGQTNIATKYCPECGTPMPAPAPVAAVWNCSCGQTNITSKFCPECGQKKPEPATWTCTKCGNSGITTKFCPECGQPKEA